MHDKRAEQHAIKYGIFDRMQALEDDLNRIDGISDIDFDIYTYNPYDRIFHVIIVPLYYVDVRRDDYFDARKAQLQQIIDVCEKHDLYPSGDRIEDMGQHWYIVRTCGESWPRTFPETD